MEFYESTYFIILIPSVVITVIFLFFWLFMKETLYDEVLAKQKRDLKFPPAKSDKKKTEKKKNKKKEAQNGNIHESDSESTPRDFKLSDALGTDEEHVVPVPLSMTEASSGVRERKKKEKKQKATQDDHVTKESEGSKSSGKKVEPVPVTKQPTPPSESAASKKKPGQKKQKNDDQDTKTDSVASPAKKQDPVLLHQEIKQENVSGKKKVSAKKQKVDNVLVDEPLIQATTYIPLMDNSDAGTVEKREVVEAVKQNMNEGIQKSSGKKMKNETDKENAEVKFKDFVMAMKNMIFTEDEARCVVEVLKEKSGAIHDALQKASKAESAAAIHQLQDKEKMLAVVKEEAAVAKEQCKQLTQELVAEKERNGLLTAKMRERINTLEKEHGTFQSKIHVSYQESQQMKMKFQQLREQMEAEISHLKQENGILRDAVSTSTNQMESKQSAELNKLRQDYARLVNELGEKSSKLQQEELQKKNAEQAVAQLKVQQQEAERRWEEIQAYLRKRTAEHEAAQQDVQNKLVAKDNEIQSLHSKLTDTMVSKQQLEQRMLQLMENEQKRATKEDSMQMRVQELIEQNDALNAQLQKLHSQMAAQTSASVLAEELHKVIAEKDKQLKQMEDSLGNEHANLTSKEEELKVLQNMNLSLKSEVQKLQALTNEQAAAAHELERMQKSIHIKDDKIRTLEEQLREELAQTANTKEEFKVLKDQNKTLQAEVQKLQTLLSEPVQPVYAEANKDLLEQMERSMREKDDKIKTVEELLEAGLIQVANKEEDLKALRTENSSLRNELQSLQIQLSEQVSFQSLVEELQKVIHEKDGKIKSVEELLQAEILKVASKEKTVQALTQKIEALKEEVGNSQLEMEKQVSITSQVKELQALLKGKENQVKTMEALLEEKEKEIVNKGEWLKGQQDTIAQLTSKVQELEQQNLQQLQQVPAASHVQDLESLLKEEKEQMQKLKAVLEEKEREIASQVKQLQDMQKENESFKVQIQELKQENCKQASLAVQSEELLQVVAGKEKEITSLQNELACQRNAFEQQRKKNNERQQHLEAAEVETRELLQKLFPNVSLPSNVSHSEWICGFEKMAKEYLRGASGSEDVKAMEQKLKEAEEMHILLQLECEKYKSVLAETEGILQRLQRSVEEEESKWKIKVEESQKELKQMRSSVVSLEHEVERLREEIKEVETLKKEREHLESELEKAEIERSTYVSEVRELKDLLTELQKKLDDSYSEAVRQNEELNLLKTQLSETLSKLKVDQNERQKVAGDLPKAQESLASLEREIGKVFGDANVIENSDVRTDSELTDKRLNVAVNLNQDVGHLKKLLVSVSQMLSKGREHYQLVE
ncbi:kinectin isoform X6 [Cygnus atratus]|uniref:kinectin isoform X6 n=1 Tax=Cygnus atratus TaxID=8868 RepID=UPI0021B7C83B|nr:kinectin isoform X6 [Cygnus atratus]